MNLKDFYVEKSPPTAYYVRDYITADEERQIIGHVNSAPKPKWTQLFNRRLQNWGGIPHSKGMIAEKLPSWLQKLIDRIGTENIFDVGKKPNHVLVNEYLPGQGIMPHLDGPLFHPVITTISCGSHAVLEFYKPYDADTTWSSEKESSEHKINAETKFLLEPRSLMVLQDSMYSDYTHGISELTEDVISGSEVNLALCAKQYVQGDVLKRDTRISLTMRHVPRTSKVTLRLSK